MRGPIDHRHMSPHPRRPTPAELRAAFGKSIPDLVAANLDVLFCGINPGLYSAATGHHFARPGNRFWPALYEAGFTPRRLQPWEETELLASGCGITNLVARGTATAAELSAEELRSGRNRMERMVRKYRPRAVAVVGIGAYRTAFDRPRALPGRQQETLAGAALWVLPSTSGLNANHRPADFARAFRELKSALE
jgi:TDG/mug DNA glycosylase family protein